MIKTEYQPYPCL